MRRTIFFCLVLCAGAGAMACGGVSTECGEIICFTDAEGGYGLDDAYVVGSRIELLFDGPLGDVISRDPNIIAVGGRTPSGSRTKVFFHAVGPGTATLVIEDDDGKVRSLAEIEVAVPTRVEFRPTVAQRFGFEPPVVLPPRAAVVVLEGGTARYNLHYFKGFQELVGRPDLELDVLDADLDVSVKVVEGRHILEVSALGVGQGILSLRTGDWLLQAAVFHVVDPDGLRSLWIAEMPMELRVDGAQAMLWLRAQDDAGREVFGLNVSWQVDEQPPLPAGDPLLSYTVDTRCYSPVKARIAHREASALVDVYSQACHQPTDVLASCGTCGPAVDGLGLFCGLLIGLGWFARRRA